MAVENVYDDDADGRRERAAGGGGPFPYPFSGHPSMPVPPETLPRWEGGERAGAEGVAGDLRFMSGFPGRSFAVRPTRKVSLGGVGGGALHGAWLGGGGARE